jgi:topoisomerase IA-like protein
VFNTYGASLKRTLEDGTTEYCKVRTDVELDLEKAKRGEYAMSELIWREENGILGKYEDAPVYLKKGKYGFYVEWKEKTYSVKGAVNLEEAVKSIEKKNGTENRMSTEDAASMFLPVGTIDGDRREAISVAAVSVAAVSEAAVSGLSGLSGTPPHEKSIVRFLRPDLSIRKGKFGNYVYHKNTLMSKPAFYPLNPIKEKWQQMDNLELIAWIENAYRITR